MVLESKFYKILLTICVSLSLISKCLSKCLNYWYQSEIVYTLNTPHDDFHRNRSRSSSSAHTTRLIQSTVFHELKLFCSPCIAVTSVYLHIFHQLNEVVALSCLQFCVIVGGWFENPSNSWAYFPTFTTLALPVDNFFY